jgi:hypothetical protein
MKYCLLEAEDRKKAEGERRRTKKNKKEMRKEEGDVPRTPTVT